MLFIGILFHDESFNIRGTFALHIVYSGNCLHTKKKKGYFKKCSLLGTPN